MSITPLITFKAGKCELDQSSSPPKVSCDPTPGYIYLYTGEADELNHFCWRPRSRPVSEPELDLLMIPGDGSFVPYTGSNPSADSNNLKSPTNGRVFVLKFSSSSQRHLFWLQSKSQHPQGNASWFSPRDQKIGQIVDMLLAGEDIDVLDEMRQAEGGDNDDGDATMEDVEPSGGKNNRSGSTGNAGADATGGDFREEGEPSREGGADGGRAAASGDASSIVQNFLRSLQSGSGSSSQAASKPFTTLPDLLSANTTVPLISTFSPARIDALLSYLPPEILLLAQESADTIPSEITPETQQAAIEALSEAQKKDILERVLRSPQLHQSLGSLTAAIRDGGLPTVSEALKIKVENNGYVKGGSMPLGGGEAVEAFLDGMKKTVEKEEKK